MARLLRPAVGLAAVLLLAGPARADPLAFVPKSATVAVKVEKPRQLAESVTGLAALKEARELAPLKDALDSTTARRLFQMLAFVEKELGARWPELLDQVAGKGVALGLGFGDNAPALLVIEGTDPKQTAKAFDLVLRLVDEELTRQGANGALTRTKYKSADALRVGDDFHAARVGALLFVSNKADHLKAGIDIALSPDPADRGLLAEASVRDARKLLPKDPLAWLWIDFLNVKRSKEAKDFFDATRKDFLQTLVAGGTIDCLRRSEFVAAGLYREPNGFRLAFRLPAGRSEFPEEFAALHVPAKGKPGTLPLLEPPGVLYSQSFYLDIGFLWENRATLLNDEVRGGLEMADKELSKFLPGSAKLGELLSMWGPHHRVVVANHDKLPYKTEPSDRYPAFGYVASMRDPQFGKSLDSIARSAGLIASLQLGMKMVEAEQDGVKIVGYRFREDKPFPDDPSNLRFNFEPAFATVGDHFVAASTVELCKKLVAELKRVEKQPSSPAVWRAKGYAAGAADALTRLPDPLVTDAVLRSGVGIEEARKQVDALAAYLRGLGTARVEIDEADTEYRLDIVWEFKK